MSHENTAEPRRQKPRAQCPDCFKSVELRKDGTFRHHTNGRPEYPGSPWSQVCTGVGRISYAREVTSR